MSAEPTIHPREHERLSRTSRDVLAYLTANAAGMHEVADAILSEHLSGKDQGEAFVTLLGVEANLLLQELCIESGTDATSYLKERGRRIPRI